MQGFSGPRGTRRHKRVIVIQILKNKLDFWNPRAKNHICQIAWIELNYFKNNEASFFQFSVLKGTTRCRLCQNDVTIEILKP